MRRERASIGSVFALVALAGCPSSGEPRPVAARAAAHGGAESTADGGAGSDPVEGAQTRDAAVDARVASAAISPDAGSASADAELDPRDVLFLGARSPALEACADAGASATRCWIAARYADDPEARALALDLYARTGDVAGVEHDHVMDGGYRGMLHIVPVLPIGTNRAHLARVALGLLDYEAFFDGLAAKSGRPRPRYRTRPIALRFMRSEKARTPSAYASGWTVAYNVAGSLNGSDDSVRETLFHEIFHLNDAAHGPADDDWSTAALGPLYARIVARCGAKTACLAPFAPNATRVRGGTYYAFQPGNDVREYAAELAIRYYREQRGELGQGPRVRPPFKCGGAENAAAWRALVAEFFDGIDLTPPCSS